MTGPPTPSRSSSFASVDTNTSSNNAALLGAATAFARPTQPPAVLRNTYSGTDGALAAATWAGAASKTPSPNRGRARSPLSIAGSPGKGAGVSGPRGKASTSSLKSNAPKLAVPQPERPPNTRSHSYQAAAVAAARAPPPSTPSVVSKERSPRPRSKTMQRPRIAPKPRRLSERRVTTKSNDEKPTDTTPIPSTTSLVDLFEQRLKSAASPRNERPAPLIIRPSQELAINSPKPLKPSEGITSVFSIELDDVRDDQTPKVEHPHEKDDFHVPGKIDNHSLQDSSGYTPKNQHPQSSPISIPVPQRQQPLRYTHSVTPPRPMTASGSKQSGLSPSPLRGASTTSSALPSQPPSRTSTAHSEPMPGSLQSLKTIPGQYHHLYPKRIAPMMSGDSLANAMVASSLASSRAHSPTRLEPPPPPTRKKKGGHYHHHHSMLPSFSRTPSPVKTGMLQTLRQHDSDDDDNADDGNHPYGKHRKRRLMRKHPNKHHEGDRKRWRDAVTERERRRYEGVWAANKGLHCVFSAEERENDDVDDTVEDMTAEELASKSPRQQRQHSRALELRAAMAEQVSNVVARDIWGRSRLSETVLEMVWDLVDNNCVGRLNKEEFVVGLWLIDQRLKGRKLPVKVSESVWTSVRGLQGIKIRRR